MQDMDIKYGFLSNYNRTVFLRQVALPDGIGLEYSPVVYHDERYDLSQRIISLRQAIFYVAMLARDSWRFTYPPRPRTRQQQRQAWIVPTM
jgi:hypothetical protein